MGRRRRGSESGTLETRERGRDQEDGAPKPPGAWRGRRMKMEATSSHSRSLSSASPARLCLHPLIHPTPLLALSLTLVFPLSPLLALSLTLVFPLSLSQLRLPCPTLPAPPHPPHSPPGPLSHPSLLLGTVCPEPPGFPHSFPVLTLRCSTSAQTWPLAPSPSTRSGPKSWISLCPS